MVWESQLIINHNSQGFWLFLKALELMFLSGWWNCDETMGLMDPQAVLSWQGWAEGNGPSFSKKCMLDELRCEQLSSDHQDGMRGRVECHQHSSDMKSHVSEWQNLVMPCRQRREVGLQLMTILSLLIFFLWSDLKKPFFILLTKKHYSTFCISTSLPQGHPRCRCLFLQ